MKYGARPAYPCANLRGLPCCFYYVGAWPLRRKVAASWFQRLGWVETFSDDWDLLLCGKGRYQHFETHKPLLRPWQTHNHCFRGALLAGNKQSFSDHHKVMREQFGAAEYTHVPQSFDLPQQHAQLIQTMR